jgi:hypothetical protein
MVTLTFALMAQIGAAMAGFLTWGIFTRYRH